MKFAGTVLYVDDVPAVMDFYRRVFGLETRFYDEALQFAELETGSASLMILAPVGRDADARPVPAAGGRPALRCGGGLHDQRCARGIREGSRGGSRGSGRAEGDAVGSDGGLCSQH